MNEKILTNKELIKKLMVLILPIAFQQFMLALVSASDALMLGGLDQTLLSAASLAGQITFVYNLFLCAMTIGTSMLVAQYYGKRDMESIEKILGIALKYTFILSFVFFLLTLIIPNQLMMIFTTDEEIISAGGVYLIAISSTFLLCSMSQIYLCIMKNSGKAIKVVVISSVIVVLNILLNAVFIYGWLGIPKLDILGAAIATVISRAVELLWVFIEMLKKGNPKVKINYVFENDKPLTKKFFHYTLPVLGNQLGWGLGFSMYSVIMGRLGNDAVAANSIANIVRNLLACFCIGLGNGGGIIVGHELGKGNLDLAKAYGNKLTVMSIIVGVITGGLTVALSPFIMSVTSLSDISAEYLKWMLVVLTVNMFGKSINCTTIGGIFCAGGDSKFGFICDTITMWCITVPLGFLAAFLFNWPVIVVFIVISIDEVIKLPAVFIHYRKYKWLKNITNIEGE